MGSTDTSSFISLGSDVVSDGLATVSFSTYLSCEEQL